MIERSLGCVELQWADTHYTGQVQNVRHPPDYGGSTEVSVLVRLDSGAANLDSLRVSVLANGQLGRALEVDELLALWQAHREGATAVQTLVTVLQRDPAHASDLLTGLAQAGLLQVSRGLYRLTPALYREAQVEQLAISPEEMILAHVQAHGRITRREVMALCGVNERQATYLLRELTGRGALRRRGSGRGTVYTVPETNETDT